ncbi:MAG TPA: hypothetical protein VFS39_14560 [Nitrospira sp.]|nr:hypothetical protein [Nitrospira sp.]
MGLAAQGPKLFTCPKCRKAYLGREALPDCPACGFDYRIQEGFRWDLVVYLLSILGLASYFLVSSSYRDLRGTASRGEPPAHDEKLPGSGQALGANQGHRGAGD